MGGIRRFSIAWALWTAAIVAFAALTSGLGGGSDDPAHWVRWISGAMMLGAYPAGVSAGRRVVDWGRPWLRPLVAFAGMTIAVGAAVVAVRGFVGPSLLGDLPGEPGTWSFGDRIAAHAEAEATATSAGTLDAWIRANQIGWEIELTITSGLTAIGLAWIGALLTVWLPTGLRREVRLAILLGAGVFLLMTGYLMTENGYEQLLLHTLGPAYVIAWFPLIAPGMAAVGLLIPTLCRLWGGEASAGGEGPAPREAAAP